MSENKKEKPKKTEKEERVEKEYENGKKEEGKEAPLVLPPLEFSSIVLPFFTQSMILFGQIEENAEQTEKQKIETAKRLIELLDLLKEKTKGNLKTEEEQFLEANAIAVVRE